MSARLIRGGLVLRADLATCRPADVLVEDGFIQAIEPLGGIARSDVETIEAADRLLVPGLVNGHTHGHGGLGKGAVGDRVPLEVFLSASGAINGSRTLEDKRLSAMLTAVELVRKGCTAAYDLFVEYPVPSREGIDAVAYDLDDTLLTGPHGWAWQVAAWSLSLTLPEGWFEMQKGVTNNEAVRRFFPEHFENTK